MLDSIARQTSQKPGITPEYFPDGEDFLTPSAFFMEEEHSWGDLCPQTLPSALLGGADPGVQEIHSPSTCWSLRGSVC